MSGVSTTSIETRISSERNAASVRAGSGKAVSGFEPKQQYDVIVVTSAVAALPQRWREWVRPGGRLLAIVGESPAQRATLFTRDAGGQWTEGGLFETDLPYLSHAAPPQRFVL